MKPKRNLPIIVAHRGLHLTHPENSLAAFQAAWASGIEWCECDVQITEDRVPVVIHDDTLDRTTTAQGRIASVHSLTLRFECRLRTACGSISDDPPPFLEDVLVAMSDAKKPANLLIEIKPPAAPELVRDVRARLHQRIEDTRRWMIQSFDPANVLDAFRKSSGSEPVAFLVEDEFGIVVAVREPFPRIHLRHDLLNETTVETLKRADKSIGVWTVNDESDIRRVIKLGVDMIITDEPLLAQRIVRDIAGEIV